MIVFALTEIDATLLCLTRYLRSSSLKETAFVFLALTRCLCVFDALALNAQHVLPQIQNKL